jgi:CHAT domain-containing protein/Flp pilus assembly protein TadD
MIFSSWIALALNLSLAATPNLADQSIEQLIQTGTTALESYRYEEAASAWREVIKRDPKSFTAYIRLGDALKARQPDAAKAAYQQAINLAPKRAEGYLRLADVSFDSQIAIYRQAIAVAEPSAQVYYMLGITLLEGPLGNRVLSVAEKEAAIDVFRKGTQIKSQDNTGVGACYVALGEQLQGQEQIDAYQAAIKLNYLRGYAMYETILEQQDRLNEIVPIYQKAIQQYPEAPNIVGLHNLLGRVLVKLKRWDEAEVAYRGSLELSPEDVDVYFLLGDVLKNQGNSDEALRLYKKAAEIVRPDSRAEPGDASSYYQVGEQLKDRGLVELAIATYKKTFELDPKEHYRAYSWIGQTLQKQGKLDEAFVAIRQSVLLNPNQEYGQLLQQQGKLEKAEGSLREAIAFYEFNRAGLSDKNKVLLAEIQATTYQLLQKILVLQNRPLEALEVAEQARSRAFAELLAQRLSKKAIPEIEASTKSPNLDQIRSIAKTQNATLVEYSIIDQKQIYIWVIKPNGEISFKLSELNESVAIAQLVANSRASISIHSVQTSIASPNLDLPLKNLHQALIAPIAAELPRDPDQQIIFLPQGDLFLVPFPALQDTRGNSLITQHTLSTAPSIQTLHFTRERSKFTKTNGHNLVVGNPTMPFFQSIQLPDLPGAKSEAIAIGTLLNTTPLLGNQATKSEVLAQMQNASIIHLATHGLLSPTHGDIPGAIALAPSGQDDGFLSAREIFDLKLTANLAVLSACDTGRGDITSDGVIGLSRSLIAAGVPSVIVSLWAVNDKSTSVLMSEFYRNLKINPNKAQALRQAMLATMKQYPDSKNWAAFTLIGEN